jgi:hypothetical protein
MSESAFYMCIRLCACMRRCLVCTRVYVFNSDKNAFDIDRKMNKRNKMKRNQVPPDLFDCQYRRSSFGTSPSPPTTPLVNNERKKRNIKIKSTLATYLIVCAESSALRRLPSPPTTPTSIRPSAVALQFTKKGS